MEFEFIDIDNVNLEKIVIKDINNKKLVDYGIYNITITTSKENIEKLKENYSKWNKYQDYYVDEEE